MKVSARWGEGDGCRYFLIGGQKVVKSVFSF